MQEDNPYLQQLAQIAANANLNLQNEQQQQPPNQQQQHYAGSMDQACEKCRAKFFPQETTTQHKYTKCCQDGKASLPPVSPPSQPIRDLYSGNTNNSSQFKKNIRHYNSALAMASWNAHLDPHPGRGPRVVTFHGQVYHLTNQTIAQQGDNPRYAQLYIMDTNQALAERTSNPQNQELKREILLMLLNELNALSRYAQSYKFMGDILRQEQDRAVAANEDLHPVRMVVTSKPGQDCRNDNPTTTEVATVYVGEDEAPPVPSQRDIVIYPTAQQETQHINAISEHADPMTYPLLFFHGEFCWHPDILLTAVARQQLQHQQIDAIPRRKRQHVTLSQFYAYRVSVRDPFSAIHQGGLLFQQYLVDAYTKIEGQDIFYIRTHQDQLRVDTYQGLMDHVQARAEAENCNVGRVIILPSTF